MIATRNRWPGTILLTGATGLVGHYVLAELLRRGLRVVVLGRGGDALDRLRQLMNGLGEAIDTPLATGQLLPMPGDLNADLDADPPCPIDDIIHTAACTRFDTDRNGDPHRTNADGTERLLGWASRHGVRSFHLVSTAYVCGRSPGPAPELINSIAPEFRNDYEASKWEAEQRCQRWRRRTGGSVTVYRPSIIVGAFESGRTTKFDGLYLSARAMKLLADMHAHRPARERHAIPLRLCGRPDDRQNVVPVDYVARMIVEAVVRPVMHGRVYHLVHPNPPTNDAIRRAYDRFFDIAGPRWVDPERFDPGAMSDVERLFYATSRPIRRYFTETPAFARHHAEKLERVAHVRCPDYSQSALMRLLAFAQSVGWHRRSAGSAHAAAGDGGLAIYFERFLAENVGRSHIARMASLTASIRFVVTDVTDAEWVCRFDGGRLVGVTRGGRDLPVDFGYSAARDVFREAVAGRVDPQTVFLTGQAEMFGDVEAAMKMAFILNAFNREFPFPPPSGAKQEGQRCATC